jgi:hypothetical protein
MNIVKNSLSALAIAGLIAGGVVAAASGDSSTRSAPPAPSQYPTDQVALSSFSVLNAAPTAGDTLPAELHPDSLPVDASTSRRLAASSAGKAWVTGDAKLVCISAELTAGGATAACDATTTAEGGFAMTSGDASQGSVLVTGLVPDGASDITITMKNGKTLPVENDGNGFSVAVDGQTTNWSFTGRDGKQHSQELRAYNGG